MKAFKGFSPELKSTYGNGTADGCFFQPGETKEESECKVMRNGFHCYENPFDCLYYYPMDGKNQLWIVEASGDINEDADGRIACTKITLIKALTPWEMAMEAMRYMVEHPDRSGWEQSRGNVTVCQDYAEAEAAGHIAISRGVEPKVKGQAGAILGMIAEDETGVVMCKLIKVTEEQADKELSLTENRKVVWSCEKENH